MRKIGPAGPRPSLSRPDRPVQLSLPRLRLGKEGAQETKRGPGPSKTRYRLARIWKKTWVRRMVLVVLPGSTLLLAAMGLATSTTVSELLADQRQAVVSMLSERPEFAVRGYEVEGASVELRRRIEEVIALPKGASTLTFDVDDVRSAIAAIPAVREARVQLDPDGILSVQVSERTARALWRDGQQNLWLVDADGVKVDPAVTRAGYADLPLLLGPEAHASVPEALRLVSAVPDLQPHLRALVRVGQRRWNVELDGDVTIMLPEQGAVAALTRVMAWHYGDDLLERGISAIDMRDPGRPTLRLTADAQEIRRLRQVARGLPGEDT